MEPTLEQVINWVKEAALMAQQMRGEGLQVRHKSKADLVTEADTAIEAFMINKIHESFPGHSVNAEETGQHDGDQENEWFIDPIDGTLNYAHGLPLYSISVAYAHRGEVKLGVIANPPMQEYFTAEAGKGSWLNGKPIRVSETRELIDSMLITGFVTICSIRPAPILTTSFACHMKCRPSGAWAQPRWTWHMWLAVAWRAFGRLLSTLGMWRQVSC